MKHNWVGAATVLGDGDRYAEAAVCEVPAQALASAVATRRSATHRRIYSVNAGGLQVVTSMSGPVIKPTRMYCYGSSPPAEVDGMGETLAPPTWRETLMLTAIPAMRVGSLTHDSAALAKLVDVHRLAPPNSGRPEQWGHPTNA